MQLSLFDLAPFEMVRLVCPCCGITKLEAPQYSIASPSVHLPGGNIWRTCDSCYIVQKERMKNDQKERDQWG